MDDLQSQMNSILQNPKMMEQIMSMAQSLGNSSAPQETQGASCAPLPEIDPVMIQKVSGLLGRSNIDKNQQVLLQALVPYLNRERIAKLEKAMRAAKLASLATALLSSAGLQAGLNG